jgi:Ca2+-binding RTX toxin-like protein
VLGLTAAQADAAPAIGLKGKTLLVKGTAGGDRLALRLHAGAPDKIDVDVGDNGSADLVVARNKVDRIRVKGGAGDDQIRIDDANGASPPPSRRASTAQGGNDAIRGGQRRRALNGDGGNDTIDGNGGTTTRTSAGRRPLHLGSGRRQRHGRGPQGRPTRMTFNGSRRERELPADGQRAPHAPDARRRAITMDFDGIERVDSRPAAGRTT